MILMGPKWSRNMGVANQDHFQDQQGKSAPLGREKASRKEEEDDPSARAFDREKDMALGSKITGKQRREIVSKASDYGSRFSKGNYL